MSTRVEEAYGPQKEPRTLGKTAKGLATAPSDLLEQPSVMSETWVNQHLAPPMIGPRIDQLVHQIANFGY